MNLEDKAITIEATENGFILRMNGYETIDGKRSWINKNWGYANLDEALAKAKEEFQ